MEEELNNMIKDLLTYEKMDKIFYNKLPKDLTKYIYDFIEPLYCDICSKCCKLCLFYCSIDCLRVDNRDVCCSYELRTEILKYENLESDIIDISNIK